MGREREGWEEGGVGGERERGRGTCVKPAWFVSYKEVVCLELGEFGLIYIPLSPVPVQLRRDYDTTLQNCEQLSQKLSSAFEECEVLRMESEEAVREAKVDKRENQRLKQLTSDLGRQVQVSSFLLYPIPFPSSLSFLPPPFL